MISAHPLCWPETIPRSKSREKGRFDTTLMKSLENVEHSLALFGKDSGHAVKDVVLSSNCSLGNNRPDDPGVAAWFIWDGDMVCIPVDRYEKVEANLQAIHHIIEARRVELRHGTLALVRATFRGFKALPPPPGAKDWRAVLGYPRQELANEEAIDKRFRALLKDAHPDRSGGSHERMSELNIAREKAIAEAKQ